MLPRASWKGHLQLSLVTVPVQAINAEDGETGEVNLHQLHAKCNSRIQYRKFCPIHGEVGNDEIVFGYEHAQGQYVVVDKQDTRRNKNPGNRAINIDTFVSPSSIDPMYFDSSVYYLVPDGEIAEKPYAVLLRALVTEKQVGIGTGTFWRRERLVAVRPNEDILCMQMLRFASRLRSPTTITDELRHPQVSKDELRMASKLIEASTAAEFDLASYEDVATQQLRELIETKRDEDKIVSSPATGKKAPPVINLMDALRRSVSQARRQPAPKPKTKSTPRRRTKRRTAG